ncbi:response regulator [Candidatus Saccharibacteria bacterium]|nr:response regulator [Candidatus Saccharibacteria bacterium]
MSKIMVVEDDASLREIYSIRITAEGYNVVSAGDGEEALAVAVREKPDLILSDVMMPKISGFDMLDILRSTPETAKIKVVMMTALSAEDQRQRGERLGADRYLVKSQVGIEDVVNVIHEVLGDRPANAKDAAQPEPASTQPAPAPFAVNPPANQPNVAK